jgi:hypothetical protein
MVAVNGHSSDRTHALATVQSGALAAPTLLGRTAMKIPIVGRIRAGIKVLTRRAEEIQEVKRIYDAGVPVQEVQPVGTFHLLHPRHQVDHRV